MLGFKEYISEDILGARVFRRLKRKKATVEQAKQELEQYIKDNPDMVRRHGIPYIASMIARKYDNVESDKLVELVTGKKRKKWSRMAEESDVLSRFRAQQGVGKEARLARGAVIQHNIQQLLDKAQQLRQDIESQQKKYILDYYFMNKPKPFVDFGYTDQYGGATPT